MQHNGGSQVSIVHHTGVSTTLGGKDKYPAKTHAKRIVEQLQVSRGLIVLAAMKARNWPDSDMPAPFRQDRYFYYLTGCNEPDTYVTYEIENDVLSLWLPPIDKAQVLWYGRGSTVEEALQRYDIDTAHYITGPKASSGDTLASLWLHFRHSPIPLLRQWFYYWDLQQNQAVSQSLAERTFPIFHLAHSQPTGETLVLRDAVDACRVIKDAHEIGLIRRANLITCEAHINIMKGLHAFQSEYEAEGAFMQACIARKAKTQAYDPIIGSGPNAAELHYSDNDAEFGNGQTLVVDAGCEVGCYASDVTRTLPINAKQPGHWPSKEAEEIYALVAKTQESCIRQMLPGYDFNNAYRHSHEVVIQGLLELGILRDGTVEEIFAQGTSAAFLPHGVGHHVGLEVHDVSPPSPPSLASHDPVEQTPTASLNHRRGEESCRLAKPHLAFDELTLYRHMRPQQVSTLILRPGMIVTIEPGVYFNKYLLDNFFLHDPAHLQYINLEVLNRYMQVGGVRVEDDILITEDGQENLTTAPKGDEALKIIRESAKVARTSCESIAYS